MSEFKYSYIIPVRNRSDLLMRGLQSLQNMDYDKDDFEVVIADYLSDDDIISKIHKIRGTLNIKYLCIDFRRYKYHKLFFKNGKCNPALAQNCAVRASSGKHIILTSPEILHWKNNLKYLDTVENLDKKFIYGRVTEKTENEVFSNIDPFSRLDKINNGNILCDWNKEKHIKKETLYFIGVMPRNIYMEYGGIDEKYMMGIAYEDEDFGNRMINIGEDKLSLIFDDNVLGIHLTHDRAYQDFESVMINKKYMDFKINNGSWINNLKANSGYTFGDLDVLIEYSTMWRN